MISSDLANLDVCAVISRDLRSKCFSRAVADKAETDFDALRAASEHGSHGAQDFTLADRFVRDYSKRLSARDALDLAPAKDAAATLATFDARIAVAAQAKGMKVAEPE